mmetsp:Transcript_20334/g.28299  ORF Transcript_20334/g.28299 Transcript_20334/m.28299 type:complete len:222 (+) Transcript_20334:170-835(+)
MVKEDEHVKFEEQVKEINSKDYQPETPLEHKMAEALKSITQKEGRKRPKFAKIQLQFPKAAEAFGKIKKIFKEADDNKNGLISLDEIENSLTKLGGTASPDEVKNLFDIADADSSKTLDFKEFIVFLCVCSLLGMLSDEHHLESAFKVAVDAFDIFDSNHSGVIVFSEMSHSLDDDAMASPDILLARMQEMDQDGNGYVIFPEFLVAFMDWVGMDDEEDEE